VRNLVQPINDILDPGEQILWSVVVNKGYSNERQYAITNRKIYRREEKIPGTHYSGAIKEYLRIVGNTLIVERIAVEFFKTTPMGEVYIKLRTMDASDLYLAFDDLSDEEVEKAFQTLSNSSNISQDYINKFALEHRELTKSWLMNLELPAEINIPPAPSGNIIQQSQTPPPLITPEKYQQPLITPEKYSQPIIQEPPPSTQASSVQPLSSSILSPTRLYHLSEDFQNESPIASPSPPPPQKITPTQHRKVDPTTSTSQLIPATDEMLYFGKICTYCKQKIEDYGDKIFSCKECGVLYHENCLTNLMNEGFCLHCNRTLIW